MDLLIKNIELPLEERIQLSIYPNGIVVNHSTLKIEKNRTTAIELPSHGRLIDADKTLAEKKKKTPEGWEWELAFLRKVINSAPTVLEASE